LSANIPVVGMNVDGTGEIIVEQPRKPKKLLENGDPYPIVTLIDFPQMVSTSHPNAEEFYTRDCLSLQRFFESKLKCVPVSGWDSVMPQWDDLDIHHDNNNEQCNIANKVQTRLDQQLQASGYSEEDGKRDMELYYHSSNTTTNLNNNSLKQLNEEEELLQEDQNNHLQTTSQEESDQDNDQSDDDEDEQSKSSQTIHSKNTQFTNSSIHTNLTNKQKAKLRVKHHALEQRKRDSRQGAFRKRNYNKNFVLGKRLHKEHNIAY